MATAAERRALRKKLARDEALHTDKKPAAAKEAAPPTVEPPEQQAPSRTRSTNTVTVGCKIPNGLILQNHVLVDGTEPIFGGGQRMIKVGQPVGNPIHVKGPSRMPGSDPDAKRVIGGYGMTFNVPREDFEQWMKDNAALDIVKQRMIFACDNVDRAQDQARDQKTVRSGLEPLDVSSRKPNGDYADNRMLKKIRKFDPDDDKTDIRGVA